MSTSDSTDDGVRASVLAGGADMGAELTMAGGSGSDTGSNHSGGGRRNKRRRQRPQPGKPPRPHEAVRTGTGARLDATNREGVFQSVEGLLRQIREQAEEHSSWSEAELRELTQSVTAFTRLLDQEADPISDRAQAEYHRIREKLSQALHRGGPAARESAGGL